VAYTVLLRISPQTTEQKTPSFLLGFFYNSQDMVFPAMKKRKRLWQRFIHSGPKLFTQSINQQKKLPRTSKSCVTSWSLTDSYTNETPSLQHTKAYRYCCRL